MKLADAQPLIDNADAFRAVIRVVEALCRPNHVRGPMWRSELLDPAIVVYHALLSKARAEQRQILRSRTIGRDYEAQIPDRQLTVWIETYQGMVDFIDTERERQMDRSADERSEHVYRGPAALDRTTYKFQVWDRRPQKDEPSAHERLEAAIAEVSRKLEDEE